MMKKLAFLTAAVLVTAALPLGAAQAQQVSVRIDTPDIGIRIGTPYPRVYGPVYAPVYAPPPVVVAPPPVYYPPRYVVAPPPRVIVPAPVVYRAPWYGPRWHGHKRWKHHHRDWD